MRRVSLVISGLLTALACGGPAPPPPDVVVTMKGAQLLYGEFADYVADAVGEPETALTSDVLTGLFDQYLDEILLRKWAIEEGLGADGDTDALLALLSVLPTREPSLAEVEREFEEQRETLHLPERVRLRQILVDEVSEARRAQAELRSGRDFAAVADRFARHAFTPAGGDQGLLAREDLPPAFEEIVFALGEGERSDIIATDYGFYIFEVVEKVPARAILFDEARPEITRRLRRRAVDAELVELVETARSRYNVRVHRANLPFDYDGHYLDGKLPDEGPEDADD